MGYFDNDRYAVSDFRDWVHGLHKVMWFLMQTQEGKIDNEIIKDKSIIQEADINFNRTHLIFKFK